MRIYFAWFGPTSPVIDDAAFASVRSLPNLKRLDLSCTNVTDTGMEHVFYLQRLDSLDISGTDVADTSVPLLKRLSSLKKLSLRGTLVIAKSVASLERTWDQATAAEAAWKQARSAFEFFTPDGRLNDRTQAEAVIAAALPHLSGAAWAKTRRLLLRRESFTFLDQVQQRLADQRPPEPLLIVARLKDRLRLCQGQLLSLLHDLAGYPRRKCDPPGLMCAAARVLTPHPG
jgi:hypothetical protein